MKNSVKIIVILVFGVGIGAILSKRRAPSMKDVPTVNASPAVPMPAPVPAGKGSQVGQKMEDFTLADQSGQEKSFYSVVKGKKALVYYFMGCCNHCVALLPEISKLAHEAESQGMAVVGVQYYGNTAFCKFTMDKHKIVGTVFADSKAEVCNRMGVGEFTTTTLDENGVIRYRGGDVNNPDQIRKSLNL